MGLTTLSFLFTALLSIVNAQWNKQFPTFSGDGRTHPRPHWTIPGSTGAVVDSHDIAIKYSTVGGLPPGSGVYKLSGTVLPVDLQSKRPNIPPKMAPRKEANKNGVYDSGHVLALFLGGPNTKYNILAQPSRWQEHGSWSQLEEKIKEYVLDKMGWGNGKTYAQYKDHVDHTALIPPPDTLVDISIIVTEWQNDAGTTQNAGLIPKRYKGTLTCRGAETETVTFSIVQPAVHAQPIKSQWKWNGAQQRVDPIHSIPLEVPYFTSSMSVYPLLMMIFFIGMGCCICLSFICGFAGAYFPLSSPFWVRLQRLRKSRN